MDLEVQWREPLYLVDGKADGLIYSIRELDEIPATAGVYVFATLHGESVSPVYIGKAGNLWRRISQQLNNVRLMRGLQDAKRGYRTLLVGEFVGKRGQRASTAIRLIETALIRAAMVRGFDIVNVRGAKTPVHTLTSRGNLLARGWLQRGTIALPRGI